MTPTEKQKCIAEQAVYGDLKVLDRDNKLWFYGGLGLSELVEGDCALYDENENVIYDWIDEITPILSHPSDLVKEITHKGYNEDKPFIPLVELAKTQYKDFEIDTIEVMDERSIMCKGYSKELSKRIMKENVKCNCAYWFHPLSSERSDEERDLLNQLHFDTRNLIESSEAIDVNTLDINPYEVQL